MIIDINSFFLNTFVIDSSMQDIPSDATSTIRDTSEIFANKMRLWGALSLGNTANNCNVITSNKL